MIGTALERLCRIMEEPCARYIIKECNVYSITTKHHKGSVLLARVMLEEAGISGMKALKACVDAAARMNKSPADVAEAVIDISMASKLRA